MSTARKVKGRVTVNVDYDFFLKVCKFISNNKNEGNNYINSHNQPLARIDITKKGEISYKILSSVIQEMTDQDIEMDSIRKLIESCDDLPNQPKLIQIKKQEE